MPRRVSKETDDKVADLTPMLDVVFIMLIFFIVTATFIKETGIQVNRPDTQTAHYKNSISLLVGVSANNQIWMNKKRVDVRNLAPMMQALHSENPKGGLVIEADRDSEVRNVIAVMDAARRIGINKISIASKNVEQ